MKLLIHFFEWLRWDILPGRCLLCGKWKLWGIEPHKVCADYELSASAREDYYSDMECLKE